MVGKKAEDVAFITLQTIKEVSEWGTKTLKNLTWLRSTHSAS